MKKFNEFLKKAYGLLMTVSFFGGIVPVVPFIAALFIGGATGEAIAVFLYKQFYPWVIAFGSVAVLVGLVSIYVEKIINMKDKRSGTKADN